MPIASNVENLLSLILVAFLRPWFTRTQKHLLDTGIDWQELSSRGDKRDGKRERNRVAA
ncbi:hypothetical protein [Nostoc sp.]|uniref:hypothetical protein n=1 Tax=Nostoc sp. TaxID=1180 RepID=UPI002FFB0A9A